MTPFESIQRRFPKAFKKYMLEIGVEDFKSIDKWCNELGFTSSFYAINLRKIENTLI